MREDFDLRVAIAVAHPRMTMLEVKKGFRSSGKLLLIALYAQNWTSIKVPVEIDLRRASFTLLRFENRENIILFHLEGIVGSSGLNSGVGRSSGPITPFQIMARASVARANCGWDKSVILSRSCLLVPLSAFPVDSSFSFFTSCETWIDSISGKLRCENERLCAVRARK